MWLLHGEVGDVGISRDLKLKDALTSGGVAVEQGAVHRGESVAGDDRGLDGEFLDVRFGLLQSKSLKKEEEEEEVIRTTLKHAPVALWLNLARFHAELLCAPTIIHHFSFHPNES